MPQLAAAEERQLHIWLTPHGFVKGALAARNATLTRSRGTDVVTFTALGKYKVAGTLDAQHLVTKVETKFAESRARRHGHRRDLLGLPGFRAA